ncbi:MAG: hypothetical protein HFJ60_00260 [Clostridia bacterium]|nr:hypothetical protein [Clostridia bacterium]
MISFAKKLNIKVITLEVNECNLSAIKLYNKFNFNKVGVRKKYYDGKNDAIIMTCNVI